MANVRCARESDIPLLPVIEREAGTAFAEYLQQTGHRADLLDVVTTVEELEAARRAGRLWVGVDDDDLPVGFAYVIEAGGYAHLDEIDVHPRHGCKGLGSALLAAVCGWARAEGFPGVTLSTFRDVPWNAPFYQRRGFLVVHARDLSSEHVRLVDEEAEAGLRTDLRVMMVRRG